MTDKFDNSRGSPSFLPLAVGIVFVALLLIQYRSIAALRAEVAALRTQQATPPKTSIRKASVRPSSADRDAQKPVAIVAVDNGDVESRLITLEESFAALNKNAEHLMDRGQLPPSEEKGREWQARFLDPNTPVKTMFGTLRLLRANGLFDDTMANHAANLLSQSTNNGVTRALLDSLRGAGNPALKPAILALAASAEDGAIRWRAVNNLRDFAASDPVVEAALWKIAREDKSSDVRGRAEDSLKRIPMTEVRQLELSQRAANLGLSFEERWSALRVLDSGKADLSQLAVSLVQSSQAAPDLETKLAYIRAFDDVNRPEFMLPLVDAVQDGNAELRLRATDALVDYRDKDPNVKEWLKVLAESDPDPRVRKMAERAFQRPQGRRR